VGADRRGPLAAFIILAVIAVILLVTSVRSQAAAGWFHTTLVAGPVHEPHLSDVTGDVTKVVEDGAVLARKAAVDTSEHETDHTESLGATSSVVPQRSDRGSSSTRHQVARAPRHHGPTSTPGDTGPSGVGPSGVGPSGVGPSESSVRHDHGRHLGWYQGHGHDGNADHASDGADDDADGRSRSAAGLGRHGRGH
jgi:hypothetical protein